MTTIDLYQIGKDSNHRLDAILWLCSTYGYSGSQSQWKFDGLTAITFNRDKDATLFCLKWS
tara:strand:+ start:146 stop:328 length:183 start_codon:yes stop_codon:yes gene_type:complete